MRLRSVLLAATAAVTLVLGPGATAASAQSSIRPHQHFLGLVNGSHVDPTVVVACPGPIGPGRTGPVVSGQHLSVARVRSGGGNTGLFSQVYAWIVPSGPTPVGSGGPPSLRFTAYGVPQKIPPSFIAPCAGSGRFEFSSCPYLAPCAAGWTPDFVTVRFISVAA